MRRVSAMRALFSILAHTAPSLHHHQCVLSSSAYYVYGLHVLCDLAGSLRVRALLRFDDGAERGMVLTSLKERLGSVLQQQRQHHGFTQSELAERANLSLKYLGEVERGEANVTVDALERIAAALEWDPWELFNNERTPISQSVHQLLIAELTSARQRLQTVIDWLLALDPATRPNVPPSLDPRKPGEGARAASPLVTTTATATAVQGQAQARRRALPRRTR